MRYINALIFIFILFTFSAGIAEEKLLATNLEGHSGDVLSVSFSPDGKYLASGSTDNKIKL